MPVAGMGSRHRSWLVAGETHAVRGPSQDVSFACSARIESEVLKKRGTRTEGHATGRTVREVRKEAFHSGRKRPVFPGDVCAQASDLPEGPGTPRALEGRSLSLAHNSGRVRRRVDGRGESVLRNRVEKGALGLLCQGNTAVISY